MASVQDLIPYIFHERQQEGSMLCAQHALNSLLQNAYFTAPDLSEIAHSLDSLESGVSDDAVGAKSTNMDDTGFFSVQVLEKALQVWGLTLVRWRSEQMKPYHDHPQNQMAFILNQSQHWYTLRRFGDVNPDPSIDHGAGHWFNLNSSLNEPEWVGKLYLGMFLQTAEQEGYSIFAVTQIDPDGPLALLRTEADEVAMTVPENATNAPGTYGGGASSFARRDTKNSLGLEGGFEGMEDEDMELQAALQASMMGASPGTSSATYYPPTRPTRQSSEPRASSSTSRSFNLPLRSSTTAMEGTRTSTRTQSRFTPAQPIYSEPIEDDSDEEIDEDIEELPATHFPGYFAPPIPLPIPHPATRSPQHAAAPLDAIEASRRRNQAMMQAFQRQQQAAMQFTHAEEQARIDAGFAPRRRQTRQEQEDEELMKAIEESRALHEARNTNAGAGTNEEPIDVDGDDEDDEDYVIPPPPRQQQQQRSFEEHRVYDDDDAELQAALKASLETVPDGFRLPSTPPRAPVSLPGPGFISNPASTASSSDSVPVVPPLSRSASDSSEADTEEFETEAEEEEVDATPAPEPAKAVDVEEMRRMRLARFGA